MSNDPYRQPLASAPQSDQYQPAPQGYGQPQGGQQQYNPYNQQQGYNQQPQQYGQPQVHVPVYQANVGPCAAGGGHSIREEFTACGLVWGILCFPIGLICCLTMKDRTCMRCGMKFD